VKDWAGFSWLRRGFRDGGFMDIIKLKIDSIKRKEIFWLSE
jgi:hypothetical protein